MRISRNFLIPSFDEGQKNKIIQYWESKNAHFTKITEREFHATRGSLLSNLVALRMDRLKTNITISVSENNQVNCTLDINTMFQYITSWNRRYWDLELKTFESFLLYDDLNEQEWDELKRTSRKKDIFFTIIFVIVIGILTFFLNRYILQKMNLYPIPQQPFEQKTDKESTPNILANKTFTSEDGSIQLTAPGDWKIDNTLSEEANLQIANPAKDKYLIVIDESKIDFVEDTTLSDYASIILDSMSESIEEMSVDGPKKVTFHNYQGLQYTIYGEVTKIKVSYLITFIDTPETFDQVVAYSLQSKFDSYLNEFKTITSTFIKSGDTTTSPYTNKY